MNTKNWETYFASMTDNELKSAWMTWGRPCEHDECKDPSLPSYVAYIAVNQEMHQRGMN